MTGAALLAGGTMLLTTLLRLGLRASGVAGLMLDDIDWRAAEIVVHGKGQRDDRPPLPANVGDAIVGYLHRGRPTTTTRREVFLRARAPVAGLGRQGERAHAEVAGGLQSAAQSPADAAAADREAPQPPARVK